MSPFGNFPNPPPAEEGDFAKLQADYDAVNADKNALNLLKNCGGTPAEIQAAEKALEKAQQEFDTALQT